MKKVTIDFQIDRYETRTPTDGRTTERKWLIAKTKEVTKCNYYEGFGFFSYLRYKDIKLFTTTFINYN